MFVGPMWMAGIVMDQIGQLSYVVQIPEGRRWKRHEDHLHDSDIPVTEPVATSTNLASASDFQDDFQFRLQSSVTSNTVAEPPETAAVPPQLEITRTLNPPQPSSTKDHSTPESRYLHDLESHRIVTLLEPLCETCNVLFKEEGNAMYCCTALCF